MKDQNLWAIWHTELKQWLRTGYEFKNRRLVHTTEELDSWIEYYKKDPDKCPKSLVVFNIDNIIENFNPLLEEERAEA